MPQMEILSLLEEWAVRVREEQCTRARHRKSHCTLCADVCPVGAISLGGGPAVDMANCTGCGACAVVCPTGALEACSPADEELLALVPQVAAEEMPVAITCPRSSEANRRKAGSVAVRCLGRLHESILVGMVAFGAESVLLADEACGECPQATLHDVVRRSVERANRLLGSFGASGHVRLQGQLSSKRAGRPAQALAGKDLSRRRFFATLVRESLRLGTATTDAIRSGPEEGEQRELKKGELPVFLPARRALLLVALGRLNEPVIPRLDAEGWATLAFTEECTGCRLCAFFCPTGALVKVEAGGRAGVSFCAAACTACGLCVDACYRNAAVLTSGADAPRVLAGSVKVHWMQAAEETRPNVLASDLLARRMTD